MRCCHTESSTTNHTGPLCVSDESRCVVGQIGQTCDSHRDCAPALRCSFGVCICEPECYGRSPCVADEQTCAYSCCDGDAVCREGTCVPFPDQGLPDTAPDLGLPDREPQDATPPRPELGPAGDARPEGTDI